MKCNSSVCNILRSHPTVFQSHYIILYPHCQCIRVLVFQIHANNWHCQSFFNISYSNQCLVVWKLTFISISLMIMVLNMLLYIYLHMYFLLFNVQIFYLFSKLDSLVFVIHTNYITFINVCVYCISIIFASLSSWPSSQITFFSTSVPPCLSYIFILPFIYIWVSHFLL